MKILIICSTSFYDRIKPIEKVLLKKKYEVVLPNCYENPVTNDDNKLMNEEEYKAFFKTMYYESREKISKVDAVLVLNYKKIKDKVEYNNYIGASTFLEMYEAFMQNKKIYVLNELPNNMLYDELKGFNPTLLYGDINKIGDNND